MFVNFKRLVRENFIELGIFDLRFESVKEVSYVYKQGEEFFQVEGIVNEGFLN